jgi:hypothetical protein
MCSVATQKSVHSTRACASMPTGISPAVGKREASQKAMAGYSVITEPSSRSSVGTFDFGFTPVNSGLNCAPSRRLTSTASYGAPISSSSTWMPTEQAPGE